MECPTDKRPVSNAWWWWLELNTWLFYTVRQNQNEKLLDSICSQFVYVEEIKSAQSRPGELFWAILLWWYLRRIPRRYSFWHKAVSKSVWQHCIRAPNYSLLNWMEAFVQTIHCKYWHKTAPQDGNYAKMLTEDSANRLANKPIEHNIIL